MLEVKPAEGKDAISIEVTEVEGETGGVVQAGGKITFEDMLGRIKPFCESIITNFEELTKKPDSASAEFGLKVSAEGNLFIVKAAGEDSLKVTLNWSLKG